MSDNKKKNISIWPFAFLIVVGTYFINPTITLCLSILLVIFLIVKYKFLFTAIKATQAYKLKDYDLALEKYKQAADYKFSNANIIHSYVILEMKNGNMKVAEDYVTNALKAKKFKPHEIISLSVTRAVALWKNGKTQEAINLLEDMLKNNENTYVYETLSTIFVITNQFDKAMEIIDTGLTFNENSTILKSNYGEVNFKLGNYKEAEETFKSLQDESITFIEPFYYYGLLLKRNEQFTEAKELFEAALNTNDSLLTAVSKDDARKELVEIESKLPLKIAVEANEDENILELDSESNT